VAIAGEPFSGNAGAPNMKLHALLVVLLILLSGCGPRNVCPDKANLSVSTTAQIAGQNEDAMTNAALVAKFNSQSDAWDLHCQRHKNSSVDEDFLNCKSYRALVAMGKPAIPFIMQAYSRKDWEHDMRPWQFLLDDITGLGMIGNRDDYSPREVRERYLAWWENERKRGKAR
jgi:hypothetical protein